MCNGSVLRRDNSEPNVFSRKSNACLDNSTFHLPYPSRFSRISTCMGGFLIYSVIGRAQGRTGLRGSPELTRKAMLLSKEGTLSHSRCSSTMAPVRAGREAVNTKQQSQWNNIASQDHQGKSFEDNAPLHAAGVHSTSRAWNDICVFEEKHSDPTKAATTPEAKCRMTVKCNLLSLEC